jgi:hypothetical protein
MRRATSAARDLQTARAAGPLPRQPRLERAMH